jgi:hypothetical protein
MYRCKRWNRWSLALQLKLMPYRESVLQKARAPRHISLETVMEDDDEDGKPKVKRVWCSRPKPLDREEQLQSSPTDWNATSPKLLLKRWGQAFIFPQVTMACAQPSRM